MEIFYDIYRPEDYAKGIVQIMHGMSEHRQRYVEFAKFLCKAGFVVVTQDHRGHGDNNQEGNGFFGSKRGWEHLIEDAYFITRTVKKEYPPEVPFILFGHSMGSLVARSYLKRYDRELDGLILCGAPNYSVLSTLGIALSGVIANVQGEKARSEFLEKLITGRFNRNFDAKTDFDWLSKNTANVESFLNDDRCGFRFTNRGYQDLMKGMKDMNSLKNWNCENKDLSILFISGEEDPVTGGKKGRNQSIKRLNKAGYKDVSEFIYSNMRHEVLNEIEHEKVFKDILQWIEEKCL